MSKLTFTVGDPVALGSTSPIQYSLINKSDIAMLGLSMTIWVNGTQPARINSNLALPNNLFPFARLASVTSTDKSATFLYHQMNGTVFAEEQWDDTAQTWLPPVYIIVSD